MTAMGLPALQSTFEQLSVETHMRPASPRHASDVVSLPMAKMIKIVGGSVDRLTSLRVSLLQANLVLEEALKDEDFEIDDADIEKAGRLLTDMKWVRQRMYRPYMADVDGYSFTSMSRALRSLSLPRPGDGRIARRQAKRVEEAAELCEAQRARFVELTDKAVSMIESKASALEGFDKVIIRAISRQSVERFPVINNYLAR